jgi:hypothetical protein
MRRWYLVVCLLACVAAPVAAQPASCSGRGGAVYTLTFSPGAGEWTVTPPAQPRITNRDRVEVCVEHFNFLRYTLTFDVAEEKSEAYAYLTQLWTSVLSPSLAGLIGALAAPQPGAPRTPQEEFLLQLQTIYALANELDHTVGAEIARYPRTGLDAQEAGALGTARGRVTGSLAVLNKAYADLQTMLLDPRQTAQFASAIGGSNRVYEAVTALYAAVVKRADSFLRLSEKTVGVEVRKVGTRTAGTRVTLTLSAAADASAKTPMADVHYFVETTMPLVVHGGMAFSRLDDVSFEKVKRASSFSEEDLFQQKSADANTRALSLFLAWQFWSRAGTAAGSAERVGVLFSIGTDLRAPGKTIFAGPSLALFNRVVLTAGATLGRESKGEAVTLEPDVFRIVRDRPATAFFVSLSTKVH